MKYIDAEKLKEKIYAEDTVSLAHGSLPEFDQGCHYAFLTVLSLIDSLQQEQFNDVRAEIKEYYGEDLAFEDERAKAAYHFFSAGKAFELREYEEERKRHITDLLDAAQKGMNAGYEKAISELKEGKVECSPVMKEFINKFFELGNTYNFGFGPQNIQLEQSKVDLEKEIKNYLATECEPSVSKTARHFFNLGFNASKEEKK